MRRVWKFPLAMVPEPQAVQMPVAARIVAGGMQNGYVTLWAECDDVQAERRTLQIVATGQDVPDGYWWVATVLDEPFVWHVYEVRS